MAHSEEDRKALGKRLSAARTLKSLTIDAAAKKLTALGYPITKQALGHWETGRNVPDALWLRRLAKLYETTLDALVWDDSLTIEATQLGAQFDGLTERQKSTLKALWMAYISESTSDDEVESKMPITKAPAHVSARVEKSPFLPAGHRSPDDSPFKGHRALRDDAQSGQENKEAHASGKKPAR